VLLGAISYASMVAVLRTTKPGYSAPELHKLFAIRRAIAARLADKKDSGGQESELGAVLADAIRQIDEQIIPPLAELIERQRRLDVHLRKYETGALPRPDGAVLNRLESIRHRQSQAIEAC